jgi:LacI family transcriptional regulator
MPSCSSGLLTWNYGNGKHPAVGFDNQHAGRLLADYLLQLGHRRFGVIAGILKDNDRASARLKGVQESLMLAGIPFSDNCVVERPYSIEGGRDGLSLLLTRKPLPTAIICGNDILAVGALYEARARHIEVPEKLSIAGFDDMPLASVTSPPLTTVHFPMAEVGTNAAVYLLNVLGASQEPVEHELPIRLTVRGSVGPPR